MGHGLHLPGGSGALAPTPHRRIVNIASIGGTVSVPHLLPYSSAKVAAVGFSEGLRAELAGTGISVTTVLPVRGVARGLAGGGVREYARGWVGGVFGLGPIGKMTARIGGARVIGVDLVPEPLALAERHDVETVDARQISGVLAEIRSRTVVRAHRWARSATASIRPTLLASGRRRRAKDVPGLHGRTHQSLRHAVAEPGRRGRR